MENTGKSTITLAATVTAIAVVLGIYIMWKKNKKARYSHPPLQDITIPTDWRPVGEVSKIYIYPLKSGRQLSVNKATCTEIGLRESYNPGKLSLRDRSFVVCNASNNSMITIRNNSKIIHLVTEPVSKDTVMFTHPDAVAEFKLKIPDGDKANYFVFMWYNEKLQGVDCGDEAAKWFSQTLTGKDSGLRLGYHNKTVPGRQVNGAWEKHAEAYKNLRNEYFGAYSDLASYMILGESSVEDLNTRLKTPVTERNFRPNILVKGSKPYEEDSWEWIKIGEAVFHAFKPTTRCTITTVDPITGIKNPDMEPLRTLRTYRLVTDPAAQKVEGNSPIMGQYMGLHLDGDITISDTVYINQK